MLFDSNALCSTPTKLLQKENEGNLKLCLYLKKTSKHLSIETEFGFLLGQIDKFRRLPKYHLLNYSKQNFKIFAPFVR